MPRTRVWIAALALTCGLAGPAWAEEEKRPERPPVPQPEGEVPPDYKQILPRGKIASIDAPEFVSAAEAEIEDDAWVLGVVIDGQAKAYSLTVLNHHEVVNDRFGELPVAAVW
jgi:hypothetical protein